MPKRAEIWGMRASTADWESTPETPSQAAVNGVALGGRATGSTEGGSVQVLRALPTATRTADTKFSKPRYAKLDGPLKALPRILLDPSQITADVLDPPQSTHR